VRTGYSVKTDTTVLRYGIPKIAQRKNVHVLLA